MTRTRRAGSPRAAARWVALSAALGFSAAGALTATLAPTAASLTSAPLARAQALRGEAHARSRGTLRAVTAIQSARLAADTTAEETRSRAMRQLADEGEDAQPGPDARPRNVERAGSGPQPSAPSRPGSRRTDRREPPPPDAPIVERQELAPGVFRCTGGTRSVDRDELARFLGDATAQARHAPRRMRLETRPDGAIGYRVEGLRTGSLYRVLGLREGDVLVRVDGQPLRSAQQAVAFAAGAAERDGATVVVERDGRPATLRFQIHEAGAACQPGIHSPRPRAPE